MLDIEKLNIGFSYHRIISIETWFYSVWHVFKKIILARLFLKKNFRLVFYLFSQQNNLLQKQNLWKWNIKYPFCCTYNIFQIHFESFKIFGILYLILFHVPFLKNIGFSSSHVTYWHRYNINTRRLLKCNRKIFRVQYAVLFVNF